MWSYDMITQNSCKSWKDMQTTFFIKIRFWVEDLKMRYYKNHMSGYKIESIRYVTLCNLKYMVEL